MPKVKGSTASEVATIESQASVVDAARRMIREKKGPLPDERLSLHQPGGTAGHALFTELPRETVWKIAEGFPTVGLCR